MIMVPCVERPVRGHKQVPHEIGATAFGDSSRLWDLQVKKPRELFCIASYALRVVDGIEHVDVVIPVHDQDIVRVQGVCISATLGCSGWLGGPDAESACPCLLLLLNKIRLPLRVYHYL